MLSAAAAGLGLLVSMVCSLIISRDVEHYDSTKTRCISCRIAEAFSFLLESLAFMPRCRITYIDASSFLSN